MFSKNTLPGFVLGIVVAIIVVGFSIAPALADDSDSLPLEPQGFGDSSLLVIPAAAFTNDGTDPDGFFFDFNGGYVNGSGTACLKTPVYLPNGVTITSVNASLYDNDPGNVTVNLRRVSVDTGTSNVMANPGTVADSTAIQQRNDTTITYPEISYPDYAYYVTTCLSSANHRLYSVRIYYEYEYKQYLPVVLRDF